jgi:ADP-ribose pyrophosphatase YjhB (NUDIX family)
MLMVRRERPPNLGLWEPPTVELRDGEDPGPALRRALRALGVRARLTTTGHLVRHGITHHAIEVEVWRASPSTRAAPAGARYVDPRRPRVALTGLARRLAERPRRKG